MNSETVTKPDRENNDDTLSKYIEEYFQENELEEIRLGIEQNIDYKLYADKKYNSIQMRQIRIGLLHNIDVNLYLDPDYDYLQMEEIRMGLEKKIDVSVYLDKNISFGIMRQLRLGLQDGVNLKKYIPLGDGILRELRYAIKDKQDITSYIIKGYDSEQLSEIRKALKSNCNIDKYLSLQFMATAIKEIRMGLEENLNVHLYADTQYDWHQMREIRLGLEKQLDVAKYARYLCSWRQMHEIRLGLEEGLDVTVYSSLMYSSKDMRKKRLELLDVKRMFEFIPKQGIPQETSDSEYPVDKITVIVEENMMRASVYIGDEVENITASQIKEELSRHNVVAGINQHMINNIADKQKTGKLYVVAQGLFPQKGKDGYYEFFIDNANELRNVTINSMNDYDFNKVGMGEKFARYHKATMGIDGLTITGNPIRSIQGKNMPILKGKGFGIDTDGKTFISLIDGAISINDYDVIITPLIELGDICSSDGEIFFNGDIHIKGNVNANVKIKAANDVIVDGYVESSYIKCGGTLCIKKGSNGNGVGKLFANGSIIGKFFESVTIKSDKSVYANTFLNCNVYAKDSIRTYDNTGKIIGGNLYAGNSIIVGCIGNKVNIPTNVQVGINDNLDELTRRLKEEYNEIEHQLLMLDKMYEKYNSTFNPQIRNTMPLYLKLENAIYTKNIDKKEVETKIENITRQRNQLLNAFIRVFGTIYDGTTLKINQISYNVSNTSKVVYKCSNNNISVTKF